MRLIAGAAVAALLIFATPALADDARLSFGGDQYSAGQTSALTGPAERDAFVVGSDVSLGAPVGGDAHLGGFDVKVNSSVGGNVYAAGFSVNVSAPVGGDVTAAGNSVTLSSTAPVTGNVRLSGASVTIAAPVSGAALVSAQTLNLDAPVSGDFSFYGQTLTFGPNARVDGTLSIRAPVEIAVPATVATADRVKFAVLETPDYAGEAGKTAGTVMGRLWPAVWGVLSWALVLFVIGIAFIALQPRGMAVMLALSVRRTWRNLGLGVLAFASVLGLVPVFAMTLVGIVLVPFILLFAVIACSAAYLAGVYFVGHRIAVAFLSVASNGARAIVLAASLVLATLLGMVPALGWFITLLFVVFGFGIIASALLGRSNGGAVTSAAGPTTPAPAA